MGQRCRTLDGGGESGGGWLTKAHAVRIKASPNCRSLVSGERVACDLGNHSWRLAGPGEAECSGCGRREHLAV